MRAGLKGVQAHRRRSPGVPQPIDKDKADIARLELKADPTIAPGERLGRREQMPRSGDNNTPPFFVERNCRGDPPPVFLRQSRKVAAETHDARHGGQQGEIHIHCLGRFPGRPARRQNRLWRISQTHPVARHRLSGGADDQPASDSSRREAEPCAL